MARNRLESCGGPRAWNVSMGNQPFTALVNRTSTTSIQLCLKNGGLSSLENSPAFGLAVSRRISNDRFFGTLHCVFHQLSVGLGERDWSKHGDPRTPSRVYCSETDGAINRPPCLLDISGLEPQHQGRVLGPCTLAWSRSYLSEVRKRAEDKRLLWAMLTSHIIQTKNSDGCTRTTVQSKDQ